jgi:arsenate reductase
MFKVLFLGKENACRSQMAEGLVNHLMIGEVKAFSAGIKPTRVHPRAIQVMAELGIEISGRRAKAVEELVGETFDLVITVCDETREQCPGFPGTEVIHMGFPDPAAVTGTPAEIMAAFRQVRDALQKKMVPMLRDQVKQVRQAS